MIATTYHFHRRSSQQLQSSILLFPCFALLQTDVPQQAERNPHLHHAIKFITKCVQNFLLNQ